jgi:hypothetical protein
MRTPDNYEGTWGERITPMDSVEQWAMHTYRYDVAARFTTADDVVLDAACGTGYGQGILSGQWVGVDAWPGRGIHVADLRTWAPDFDYDVFVGLETIEHIDPLAAYLAAAKRAKRAIVISTPIIPTTHFNPHHVHDFTRESLEQLFVPWVVEHYETQADPLLGPDIYGIWVFGR